MSWPNQFISLTQVRNRLKTVQDTVYSIDKLVDLFMFCHVFISPDECLGRVRFYCAESAYFPVLPVDLDLT